VTLASCRARGGGEQWWNEGTRAIFHSPLPLPHSSTCTHSHERLRHCTRLLHTPRRGFVWASQLDSASKRSGPQELFTPRRRGRSAMTRIMSQCRCSTSTSPVRYRARPHGPARASALPGVCAERRMCFVRSRRTRPRAGTARVIGLHFEASNAPVKRTRLHAQFKLQYPPLPPMPTHVHTHRLVRAQAQTHH
jgi:hypothetical protein